MKGRLAAVAVALAATGCSGSGSSPPAAIRLLEGGARCAGRCPGDLGPPPANGLPVEIDSVPAPGRAGRILMHDHDDGRDARLALVAPAGSRYEAAIRLPRANPVLQVALGYSLEDTAPGLALRFRVILTPAGGDPKEVLAEAVTTAADGRWIDREVDLAAWAGDAVRLEFVLEGPTDAAADQGAWGAPEVFARDRQPEGWDVVLVVLDTLRADRLGCYGYDRPTSPRLDELAARSIRFATAVSQSSWTRPSHRSLFSGLYPESREGLSSPPLAEVLWRRGYRTLAITGGAQLAHRFGFSRGFDKHEIERWVRSFDGVVETLEASRSRRRFLFLHTYEIHDPYVHRELAAGLDPGRVGEVFRRATLDRLGRKLTDDEKTYVSALYDSGISFTDARLGLLLDRLGERRLLDRSIVVVTSDHGEELWDHGQWGHGRAMYDHQSLVPLIVHLPDGLREELGIERESRVVRQQVRLVDLYPTLLDLLGIPLDHPVQGRSLRPLLEGGRLPAADAFSESVYWGPVEVKALRSERYKYLRGVPKTPGDPVHTGWEALFDLSSDPGEKVDVREADRRALERMRALVDRIVEPGSANREELVPKDLDPELAEQLRSLGYLD